MVLLAAIPFAQGAFAFSSPAAPASKVVPALGKAGGIPLTVAPVLAREVLLIEAQGTTLKDLMARVAQATGGEWEARDGGYRLTLSSLARQKQERTEALARGEGMLADARSRSERAKDAAHDVARTDPIWAILATFSAEELGRFGFKERIVYSTRPTAMQRPLPTDALAGVDLARIGDWNRGGAGQIVLTTEGLRGPQKPSSPGPVAVVQLALQDSPGAASLNATLVAANAAGDEVSRVNGSFSSAADDAMPKAGLAPLPRPDAPILLSPEERATATTLAEAYRWAGMGGLQQENVGDVPLTATYSEADLSRAPLARARPELLHPETREPLEGVAGPLLRRFAEGQGTNLVADLPDAAFGMAVVLGNGGAPTAEIFAQRAWSGMKVEVVSGGGWTVVRPRRFAAARANRLDRVALGTALRLLDKNGTLSLDEQAAYAAAQPLVHPNDGFEAQAFAAVDPSWAGRMADSSTSGERQTLRLYRALSPHGSEGPRPFGNLPPAARSILTDLVYGSAYGLEYTSTTQAAAGATTRWRIREGFGPASSLATERTVLWPDGIPAGATLTVDDASEPTFFGVAPNGSRPMIADRGLSISSRRSGNGVATISTNLPHLASYQRASARRVRFVLKAGENVEFTRGLLAASIPADAPTVAFEDLPESLRKRIESADAQARKMREQAGRGGPPDFEPLQLERPPRR